MMLQILWFIYDKDTWMTATKIAKHLDRPVSSVSSVLLKMTLDGRLRRKKGVGPLGGFGYNITPRGWRIIEERSQR